MNEDAARPTMLDGLANVECARVGILHAVDEDAILTPRNLCSKLLHNFTIRPGLGKSAHVLEITNRISTESWELAREIGGESIDYLRAPSSLRLVGKDVMPNFPVVEDQFRVSRQRGFDLRSADSLFDAGKEARVVLCSRLLHNCLRRAFSLHALRQLA